MGIYHINGHQITNSLLGEVQRPPKLRMVCGKLHEQLQDQDGVLQLLGIAVELLPVEVNQVALPFGLGGEVNAIHDGAEDIHGIVGEGVYGNVVTKHLFSAEVELFFLGGPALIQQVCNQKAQ